MWFCGGDPFPLCSWCGTFGFFGFGFARHFQALQQYFSLFGTDGHYILSTDIFFEGF
jgi:hypothetical protein